MSSLRIQEHEANGPAQSQRNFLRSLPWNPEWQDTQLASNGSKDSCALSETITIKPINFN